MTAEQLRLFAACGHCGDSGWLTIGVCAATPGAVKGGGPNRWPSRKLDCHALRRPCPACQPVAADAWLQRVREAWAEDAAAGR